MATDIQKVLLAAQDAVDGAVATVTATTKTENTLQKNITITDRKIGIHNEDPEAHGDIRDTITGDLSQLLIMVTDPIITGPTATETGMASTWGFSAQGIVPTVQILKFIVTLEDGTTETINVDNPENTVSVSWTHTFIGERNSEHKFTVQAVGSYKYTSARVPFDFVITHHLPPVMGTLTHTIPAVVSYGKRYDFKVEGITDLDDDFTHYNIYSSNPGVTFSVSDHMDLGQTYQIICADTCKGPVEDCIITIEAVDEWDLKNSYPIHIRINSDPEATNIVHSFPTYLNIGETRTVRVANATDPDGDTLVFDIASSIGEITFGKHENIGMNEDFTVIVAPDAVAKKAYTLTLTFKDPYGGTCTATISSTLNTAPNVSQFVCTKDTLLKKNEENTISFAGSTDDEGEKVLYYISNPFPELHFSKTSAIDDDEPIQVTFLPEAERGKVYNIDVISQDVSGAQSIVSVPLRLNHLPNKDTIESTIIPIVLPDTTYTWKFTAGTDNDNQLLTYTVTTNNDNVFVLDADHIHVDNEFTVKVPDLSILPRGSYFNLLIEVTDGLETDHLVLPIQINRLPSIADLDIQIPSRIFGGSENALSGSVPACTEPDNQDVTYKIYPDEIFHFEKTEGILPGEQVSFYADKVSECTTRSIRITLVDVLGEESADEQSFNIEVVPIIVTGTPSFTNIVDEQDDVEYEEGFVLKWDRYYAQADIAPGPYGIGELAESFAVGSILTTDRRTPIPGNQQAAADSNNNYGMTQAECDALYAGTPLEGKVTIVGRGFQKIVIPHDGTYRITCVGAQGGAAGYTILESAIDTAGGRGAVICADVELHEGDILYFLIGQVGWCNNNTNYGAGGGGATAVFLVSSTGAYTLPATNEKVDILIVAGGGAGRMDESQNRSYNIMLDNCGMNAKTIDGANPGTAGTGSGAAGGGSLTANGAAGSTGLVSYGLLNCSNTTNDTSPTVHRGGYGGGGGSYNGGGGGGGYSGGNGTENGSSLGGTSYINPQYCTEVARALEPYKPGEEMHQGRAHFYCLDALRFNMVPNDDTLTEADLDDLNSGVVDTSERDRRERLANIDWSRTNPDLYFDGSQEFEQFVIVYGNEAVLDPITLSNGRINFVEFTDMFHISFSEYQYGFNAVRVRVTADPQRFGPAAMHYPTLSIGTQAPEELAPGVFGDKKWYGTEITFDGENQTRTFETPFVIVGVEGDYLTDCYITVYYKLSKEVGITDLTRGAAPITELADFTNIFSNRIKHPDIELTEIDRSDNGLELTVDGKTFTVKWDIRGGVMNYTTTGTNNYDYFDGYGMGHAETFYDMWELLVGSNILDVDEQTRITTRPFTLKGIGSQSRTQVTGDFITDSMAILQLPRYTVLLVGEYDLDKLAANQWPSEFIFKNRGGLYIFYRGTDYSSLTH